MIAADAHQLKRITHAQQQPANQSFPKYNKAARTGESRHVRPLCHVEDVSSVERKISLIDSIKDPRGVCLGRYQPDYTILFDKCDSWIRGESESLLFRHAHEKTFDGALIRVALVAITAEITRETKRFAFDIADVVFEHHDVLIGDSFVRAHATEFRTAVLALN